MGALAIPSIAGNITSDTRSGTAYAYTYNKRNRLNTVRVAGMTNDSRRAVKKSKRRGA